MTEKEKKKQYKKDFKEAKKELINIIKKDYAPWDNFLGNFFLVIIDHWKKYYSLGYNVWGKEICDTPDADDPSHPTRYEIACELERRYKAWTDFSGVEEIVSAANDLGYEVHYKKEFCGPDGKTLDVTLFNQEDKRLKQAFFDYYMRYAAEMWD